MRSILFISILLLVGCRPHKIESVESYLDLKGNKIHYKIDGAGPEILFVHGGYLSLEMWTPQVNEFEDEYEIIRFSDIGHGKSRSSDTEIYGYEIIENLAPPAEADKCILVGLSWGAMLCVDYALNHPEKVEKLILVSPGLNGWDYFQDSIASANNKLRQVATQQNDIARAAELFHQNWVVGPRRNASDLTGEFYQSSLDMIATTMRDHWQEEWSNLDTIPAITRLEQINIPTYIIVGNQDAKDIDLIAKTYDQRLPDSKLIVMEGVAHLLTMENPTEFNRILRAILNE